MKDLENGIFEIPIEHCTNGVRKVQGKYLTTFGTPNNPDNDTVVIYYDNYLYEISSKTKEVQKRIPLLNVFYK